MPLKENAYSNRKSLAVIVKNINSNEISYFPSIRRAALFVNVHYSYISECLNKKGYYEGNGFYITKNIENL